MGGSRPLIGREGVLTSGGWRPGACRSGHYGMRSEVPRENQQTKSGQVGTLILLSQAFNRGKREGFFLKSVENAPLAKRRKQKLRSAAASRRGSPVPASSGRLSASATKGAPRRANGPLSPS